MRNASCMECGEEAIIIQIKGVARDLFLEQGLIPGRKITMIHRGNYGGPLEIKIGNMKLALRRSEAENIIIRGL